MKIINEKRSRTDNILISCIVEYGDRLFRIADCSPTKLFVWSGWNGWLFIDYGERKETTQESIDQFIPIMKAYTNEKEK